MATYRQDILRAVLLERIVGKLQKMKRNGFAFAKEPFADGIVVFSV
jgi:hypothetical protein